MQGAEDWASHHTLVVVAIEIFITIGVSLAFLVWGTELTAFFRAGIPGGLHKARTAYKHSLINVLNEYQEHPTVILTKRFLVITGWSMLAGSVFAFWSMFRFEHAIPDHKIATEGGLLLFHVGALEAGVQGLLFIALNIGLSTIGLLWRYRSPEEQIARLINRLGIR